MFCRIDGAKHVYQGLYGLIIVMHLPPLRPVNYYYFVKTMQCAQTDVIVHHSECVSLAMLTMAFKW